MYSNKRIMVVDIYNDGDTNGTSNHVSKRIENGSFPGFDGYDLEEGNFNFGAEEEDDDLPNLVKSNGHAEDFVTVVKVDDHYSQDPPVDGSFVTVLEVQEDRFEEVTVYRLPGERLGMALKFEGGMNSSDTVSRVFIQSINPDSPAARAQCSNRPLREGDEIIKIDGTPVSSMTRIDCVSLLRDAPVCIKIVVRHKPRPSRNCTNRGGELRPIFPRKKKGPPPPVPPRKSSSLIKLQQQHQREKIDDEDEDEDSDSNVIYSVRETVQRLEARSAVKRPVHPPPLPPQRLKMDPCFSPDELDSSPKEKPNFPGASLSTKLPGWEELMLRRAAGRMDEDCINGGSDLPVKPDVYMDLIAEEDKQVIESESDDTGSSVSTVRERFSRTSTANSSFSEHSHTSHDRDSTFDLEQVLSPFEQLERELDADTAGEDESNLVEGHDAPVSEESPLTLDDDKMFDCETYEQSSDSKSTETFVESSSRELVESVPGNSIPEPPEHFQDSSIQDEESLRLGEPFVKPCISVTEDADMVYSESEGLMDTTECMSKNGTTNTLFSNETTNTLFGNGTTNTLFSNGTTNTLFGNHFKEDVSSIRRDGDKRSDQQIIYSVDNSAEDNVDMVEIPSVTSQVGKASLGISDDKPALRPSEEHRVEEVDGHGDYHGVSDNGKNEDEQLGKIWDEILDEPRSDDGTKRSSAIAKPPVPEKKKKLSQPPPVPPRRSKVSPQTRRNSSSSSSEESPPSPHGFSLVSRIPRPISQRSPPSIGRGLLSGAGKSSPGSNFRAGRRVCVSKVQTVRKVEVVERSTSVTKMVKHKDGSISAVSYSTSEGAGERFAAVRTVSSGHGVTELSQSMKAAYSSSSAAVLHHPGKPSQDTEEVGVDTVPDYSSQSGRTTGPEEEVENLPVDRSDRLQMGEEAEVKFADVVSSSPQDSVDLSATEGSVSVIDSEEMEILGVPGTDGLASVKDTSIEHNGSEPSSTADIHTEEFSIYESSPSEIKISDGDCSPNDSKGAEEVPLLSTELLGTERIEESKTRDSVSTSLASGFVTDGEDSKSVLRQEDEVMDSVGPTLPFIESVDSFNTAEVYENTDEDDKERKETSQPEMCPKSEKTANKAISGSLTATKKEQEEHRETAEEKDCLECLDRVLEENTVEEDLYQEENISPVKEEMKSPEPTFHKEREVADRGGFSDVESRRIEDKIDLRKEKVLTTMEGPRALHPHGNRSPPPTFSRQPPDGHEFPPDYTDPVTMGLSGSDFVNKGKPSELEDSGIFLDETSPYINNVSSPSSSGVSTYDSTCSTPSEDGHQMYTSVVDCVTISKVSQDPTPRISDEIPLPKKSIRSEVCIEIGDTLSESDKDPEVGTFIHEPLTERRHSNQRTSALNLECVKNSPKEKFPLTYGSNNSLYNDDVDRTSQYKQIEPLRERRFSLMEGMLDTSVIPHADSSGMSSRCKSEDNLLLDEGKRMAEESSVNIVSIKDRIAMFSKRPPDHYPHTFKSQQFIPVVNKESPTMRSTGSLYFSENRSVADNETQRGSLEKASRRTSTGSISVYPTSLYSTYDSQRSFEENNKFKMSVTNASTPSMSSPKEFDIKNKNCITKDDFEIVTKKERPFISNYPQTQLSGYRYFHSGLTFGALRSTEDNLPRSTSLSLHSLLSTRRQNTPKLKGLVIPERPPTFPTIKKELPTILSCTSVLLSKPESLPPTVGIHSPTSVSPATDKKVPFKNIADVNNSKNPTIKDSPATSKTVSPLLSEPPWKNGALCNLPKYSPAFKRRTLELPTRMTDMLGSSSTPSTPVTTTIVTATLFTTSNTTPSILSSSTNLTPLRNGHNQKLFNYQMPLTKSFLSSKPFPISKPSLDESVSKSKPSLLFTSSTSLSGSSTLPRTLSSSTKSLPSILSGRSAEEPLLKLNSLPYLSFSNSSESRKRAELAENQKKKLSNMSSWIKNDQNGINEQRHSTVFNFEPETRYHTRQLSLERTSPPFRPSYSVQTTIKNGEKEGPTKLGFLSYGTTLEQCPKFDSSPKQFNSTDEKTHRDVDLPGYQPIGHLSRGPCSFGSDRLSYWLDSKRSLPPDSDDDTFSSVSFQTEDSQHLADDSLSDATSDSFERGSTEPDFKPRLLSQQRTVLRTSMDNTDSVRNFRALAEKWQQRAGENCEAKSPPLSPPSPPTLTKKDLPRTPINEPSFRLPPSLMPRSLDQLSVDHSKGPSPSVISTPARAQPRLSAPRLGSVSEQPEISARNAFVNGRTQSIESLIEKQVSSPPQQAPPILPPQSPASSTASSISAKPTLASTTTNTTSSVSVHNIRKAFEGPVPESSSQQPSRLMTSRSSEERAVQKVKSGRPSEHVRLSSLDSTASESETNGSVHCSPLGPLNSSSREKFGSVSSLASTNSGASSLDAAQVVEEAKETSEETTVTSSPEITAVVLHRETPRGSIGITLAGGADYEVKEITVHKVIGGSLADKDGRIRRGDRILSINGRSMQGVSHREALEILKSPRYDVVLVLLRDRNESAPDDSSDREKQKRVSVLGSHHRREENVTSSTSGPSSSEKGLEVEVHLMKDGGGLGFSLEGGKESPLGDVPLRVKRVFTGGVADRDGTLKSGDVILSINGQSLSSMTRTEAWNYMKKLPDGSVTLCIRPSS